MTDTQLEQLSQEELLKLFIEKSRQVEALQARLTVAEAQLTSLGLIREHIKTDAGIISKQDQMRSAQWQQAVREKLEQLTQTHAELQALLNRHDAQELSP